MTELEPSEYLRAAQIGARLALRHPSLLHYVREEAIGAAIEELVIRRPSDFSTAVVIARSAAIDELRRFTDWNRRTSSLNRSSVKCDPEDVFAAIAESSDHERAVRAVERWERAITLARLDDRSLRILTLYAEGYSLEEIGLELGVGASRVSQLRTKALNKLRACANGGLRTLNTSTGGHK